MTLLQTVGNQHENYQDAHLYLDFQHKAALLDDGHLKLTRKEYELLALLVQNAGEIVSREDLLLRVWGYGSQIRTRTLDVHIRRLRKKLGEHAGLYIETIFGIGYRFQPYRAHMSSRQSAPLALGA
jgi:two-component system, OmpR family, alkaline phosphatase synthesis response regulator PhoP